MEGMRPVDPGAGPESTAPRAPMARPTRSAASPASESRYSTDPGWPDSDGSTARPRALPGPGSQWAAKRIDSEL